ncbi:GxxExxY protein [Phenylobacterium sp.]|uniref:GxxExxY protein n=1 Tax=Phenylobacterium sp. TaxID=1871053 RepID=UPI0025E0D91C|nr:GxxExxY protein [Phenylobacterium sp.]MBX3483665.1 GxxExxY protein [Phenylobacterium sp.]MCW5735308.1 GxxExxY protein [Enhydrobacter sp.]MCW5759398.1 GxxExxY protein [Phenylobacterium sp.]
MDHEPHEPHERLLHREEVFAVQGAIFEVNRVLGVGFLEAAYQESLGIEFGRREIPFVAQPKLGLSYKGTALRAVYIPDFICFGCVLVELKAASAIAPEHRAQVINYLKAADLRVGLLVNFGGSYKAQIERLVR